MIQNMLQSFEFSKVILSLAKQQRRVIACYTPVSKVPERKLFHQLVVAHVSPCKSKLTPSEGMTLHGGPSAS